MAYKPPKQQIDNNDVKNIPSSEAIYEALKYKIDQPTISGTAGQLLQLDGYTTDPDGILNEPITSWVNPPSGGANTTLSNLVAPTAINQDLLLDADKKIRLNASENVNTLLHVKSSAATPTGIFFANSAGNTVTVFPAGLFQVGDFIKVAGRPGIGMITAISGLLNNLTVNASILSGATFPVEIEKVKTNATFRDESNAELFSFISNRIYYPASANVIFGNNAGTLLTSGTDNIFIGSGAGRDTTTQSNIVAIGTSAGLANATSGNVFIGSSAGSASTGSGLVCIGDSAGTGTGLQSVAIGQAAGAAGNRNICIGNYAGYALTSASDGNVIIGKDGAFTTFKSGNHSIIIGRFADTRTSNASGAIVLGAYGVAPSNGFSVGSASYPINTMYIGRGGALQTGTTAVKIMTTEASGTDTDLSSGSLTLAGSRSTGNKEGSPVIISTAPAGASGSTLNAHVERLRVTAAGDVGIGTATPGEKLEVSGNIKATSGDVIIDTEGKGLKVKTGTNAKMGMVSFANVSSVTVNTTAVSTGSLIFVTQQDGGYAFGVSNIVNGTSFDISHHGGNITANVAWVIIDPA